MSASDLVPRVVLLVTDLERENAELKSQLEEHEDQQLLVQITGPNGTPIYYEGSLKNGHSHSDVLWRFEFKGMHVTMNNGVLLPFSLFTTVEIWLGGILIENFQNFDRLNRSGFSPDDSYDYDSVSGMGMGTILIQPGNNTRRGRGPLHMIYGSFGPMTFADYNIMMDAQLDLEEQLALYEDVSWKIESIMFRKDKIRGIMALLRKLGIPTSDADRVQGRMEDDNDDDDDDVDDDVDVEDDSDDEDEDF